MAVNYSGDEVTERESLADTIAVRSPMSVPMLTRLPQKTISNRMHEWSVDAPFTSTSNTRNIGTPHANTRFEGADYVYRDTSYPTRLRAICEIQQRGIEVSGTDRTVIMAGTDSTFDYRSGQMVTELLNNIDNVLLYGQGSPELSGKVGATNQRQCQGLLHWAAWTGLERVHGGGGSSMTDPYGVDIPSQYWSVFHDFEHTNITGESFYQNVVRRLSNAGADMSQPWEWWAGDGLMGRISKFMVTDTGRNINERTTDAASGGGYDYLHWVVLPNGTRAIFRSNHWLDNMTDTFVIDNSGLTYSTPGSPSIPGTEARTFSGDQTLLGRRIGAVTVCWLRSPGFERVDVDGDRSKLIAKAEFTLEVNHPLDVGGAGNCSS